MADLCRGEMTERKGAPRCPRRRPATRRHLFAEAIE